MRTRLYPTPTFAAQLVNFYTKTGKIFEGDYRQFGNVPKREALDKTTGPGSSRTYQRVTETKLI